METNLVSRASVNRTAKALEEKIYANGGHWAEVTLKKTGEKIVIGRMAHTQFEKLYNDAFKVTYADGTQKIFKDVVDVKLDGSEWLELPIETLARELINRQNNL